jgi:hypothetical protein
MRAHQGLHAGTITPPVLEYEQISRTTLRPRFESRQSARHRRLLGCDSAPALDAAISRRNLAAPETVEGYGCSRVSLLFAIILRVEERSSDSNDETVGMSPLPKSTSRWKTYA